MPCLHTRPTDAAAPGLMRQCLSRYSDLFGVIDRSSSRAEVSLVLAGEYGRHIRLAQARGRLDQRVEHRLQIERRAADDLEHVGGGGLLLQGFAQLVEQPRVLDGDDRLGGEVL